MADAPSRAASLHPAAARPERPSGGTVTDAHPVAVVYGATRGIGLAVAWRLAESGHRVVAVGRPDARKPPAHAALAGTLDELERDLVAAFGERARPQLVRCDVLDSRASAAVVDDAEREWGRVDVVVVSAVFQGAGASQRVAQLELDELERYVRGNFTTCVAIAQRAVAAFARRGSGTFVQLVSRSSRTAPVRPVDKGGFMALAYVAPKAAVAKLVPLLAVELRDVAPHVRVFNVDPGLVITETMKQQGTARMFERWGTVDPDVTGRVVARLATAPRGDPLAQRLHGVEFVHAPQVFEEVWGTDAKL